jgi:REP element-mobilizing transposase RayT
MEKQFYRRHLPHWQIPEATYFVTYRLYGSVPRPVIEQLKADYRAALAQSEQAAVADFCISHGLTGMETHLSIGMAEADFWTGKSTPEVRSGEVAGGPGTPEARSGEVPGATSPERTSGVLSPERTSGVHGNSGVLPPELYARLERIGKKKVYDERKRYFARFDDLLDQNLNEPYWLQQPEIAAINTGALHFYHEKLYRLYAFCIMSNHIHMLFEALPDAPPLETIMQRLKRYTAVQSNRALGREGSFWETESYDHIVRQGEFDRILAYILNNPVKAGLVSEWNQWQWTYCA